jgi:2-hydroxy-3-keto-5-methylthiopentenyl-1-phosphate phosphatase
MSNFIKIPVILIDEKHGDEECSIFQHKFLNSQAISPENTLLVEEGINPCIDSHSENAYKILNEYLLPESADAVTLQRIFLGAVRDETLSVKTATNRLFEKIPNGLELQEQMFALSDDMGNYFNNTLAPLIREIYEKILESPEVDKHIKPVIEIIKKENFPYELPGQGGTEYNVHSKLMFLRDMYLVKAIERKIKEDSSIQLVIIIRGADHRTFTQFLIDRSPFLRLRRIQGNSLGREMYQGWFNRNTYYKNVLDEHTRSSQAVGGATRRRKRKGVKQSRKRNNR